MRLVSIDISNFRVIRNARLRFDDRITGIIGPNGAGKSSIVEAVAWALYGNRVARSGKDEIKSVFAGGDESCQVALEFELGPDRYRVVRRLIGRTDRPEVLLERNDTAESVGSTETERQIVTLLGLDWRGFLTSFLARQQELNALADLTPGQRREHLAGMLGIQRLDKAIERVKNDTRGLSDKADMLRRQLAVRDSLLDRVKQLREQITPLRSQREITSGAYEHAKVAMVEADRAFREQQEKRDVCSRINATLDALKATCDQFREQIEQATVREKRLTAATEELKEHRATLVGFDELKKRFDSLTEARQKIVLRDNLTRQAESGRADLAGIEEKLATAVEEVRGLESALAEIPEDIERRHEQVLARLEKARADWSESKARSEVNRQETVRLKAQMDAINDIGPEAVCDRCHRPYGDDLPAIRTHLEKEMTELVRTGREVNEVLAERRRTGEHLKDESEKVTDLVQQARGLKLRLAAAQRTTADFETHRRSVSIRLEELNGQLAGLDEIAFDPEEFQRLNMRLIELEKVRARTLQLEGEVKALPETTEQIATLNKRLAASDGEISELERQRRELGFDEGLFDTIKESFAARQQELDNARDKYREIDKELEITVREHEIKMEELARLDKMSEELDRCREDQFYAEKLSGLFTDFRKFTISRIRPRLAQLAGDLMAEMSGGRYSLVELDKDYELRIMDYGQYYGIDRYSGGEKDLASLCLRLAISLALTESAGLDRSFVILDEVFGSQDSGRRELIFQALANLRGRFPQMLLITHLEELKNNVETLVEVVPASGGWSEVRVNGNSG